MKRAATILGLATLALTTAACSSEAKKETSQAANAIGSDMERAGQDAAAAGSAMTDSIDAKAKAVGNDISRGADAAADATGAALQNAGAAIRDQYPAETS